LIVLVAIDDIGSSADRMMRVVGTFLARYHV